jgi:NadR type nicotinamide-nucleotide adenylyltransferase
MFLGFVPDAVFTSEDYGAPWARAMGCAHVSVDRERATFPVSGTEVRANPYAMWDFLEPPVRAHYAKRICVLGAESTGTTTLARSLAAHYGTVWVPEYGRMYAEGKYGSPHPEWHSDEFLHIAEQQVRMEDRLAREADRVLICDTDPLATSVWHERYMEGMSAELVAIARRRRYDMYILTGDEIPFEQDGTRDGEHVRHAMHRRFERVLEASGKPFIVVRGSREDRLKAAVAAIDPLICRKKTRKPTRTSKSRPTRSSLLCATAG